MKTILQSLGGMRSRFDFEEGRLRFTTADRSGEVTFRAPYDLISLEEARVVTSARSAPTVYLWAAGIPLCFTALRIQYAHNTYAMALGGIGFALLFLGILAQDRKWFVVKMDVIPVQVGGSRPLRVLHDAERDAIIAELAARRRFEIRKGGIEVNLAADPQREAARLDWLLEQEIIDEGEHATSIEALRTFVRRTQESEEAGDPDDQLVPIRKGALH